MPAFLEKDLERSAAKKGFTGKRADRYIYGAMNNRGLMSGNRITPKGLAMEKKHKADMAKGKKAGR